MTGCGVTQTDNTYARISSLRQGDGAGPDPSIKLIAVGDNNMNWNRTVPARGERDYRLPGNSSLLRSQEWRSIH